MKNNLQIKIKRINYSFADVPLPSYSTNGSSGLDIRATVESPLILESGDYIAVPTNLLMEIPTGYEIQVRPRSGLAIKNGVTVLNSPGTIDSDYRGEVKILLINHSKNPFTINRGDRIAQLVVAKVTIADIIEVDQLSETERGMNGFGHTGVS